MGAYLPSTHGRNLFWLHVFYPTSKASIFALLVGIQVFIVRFYWRLRIKLRFWGVVAALISAALFITALCPETVWMSTLIVLAIIATLYLTVSVVVINTVESVVEKKRAHR
jgi:hypothetical protein